MRTLVRGQVVLPRYVLEDGAILVEEGRIAAVARRAELPAAGCQVVEHDGLILPGFVDIHVHGGRGADFMDGTPAAFETAARAHARHGTTSLVATTTVAPKETMRRVLETCRQQVRASAVPGARGAARILGLHFYGPYFRAEAVGCHPDEGLAAPDTGDFAEYLTYSDTIVSATVAPELAGAESFAGACRERGIVVNAGHSHCTFEQMEAALRWGVRHVDHLFCAMSDRARLREGQSFPMRGGLMEATLYFDELSTEVIADGRHLARELLLLAYKVKGPDRLALMTDANRALDMPDGEYIFGPPDVGRPFRKEGGVGVTLDGAKLASAVMGMDHMTRTFHKLTKVPFVEAVRMASLTPARIIGKSDQIGSIEVGKRADLVFLDRQLQVRQVWIDGLPIASGDLLESS